MMFLFPKMKQMCDHLCSEFGFFVLSFGVCKNLQKMGDMSEFVNIFMRVSLFKVDFVFQRFLP